MSNDIKPSENKSNPITNDIKKYNSWPEFCRLSHGNASLYDRIVYLYGLRMDQLDNHDKNEDKKEDAVTNNHKYSKKCHIIEYEQNYLTEVENLYTKLSIEQLQEILQAMENLSALRHALRKQCNANKNTKGADGNTDESIVTWESDNERTVNVSHDDKFSKLMTAITHRIQILKFEKLWNVLRPFIYCAAAVLLLVMAYWGVVMYSGHQFSSQLAQFDNELLTIREKTGEAVWKKSFEANKWNVQSEKAADLYSRVAKVDIPFLARQNFSIQFFNRSEGDSFITWNSYERLKEDLEQRIKLYQTFSKSVDECGKALEKGLNENSIVPMESACWDGLVYPDKESLFTFEKNTSEKETNDGLINQKNNFIKKWSENINSSFAKSMNEHQSKFNVVVERNDIKQMVDIYNTIVGLPNALKAKKYLNSENNKNHELLTVENAKRIYDFQLKSKRKEAEAVLDNIDKKLITKDAGLSKIKSVIQDVNALRPYNPVPEDYAVQEKEKTVNYINEIMNHADDYKYIVLIKDTEDKIKELTIPDASIIQITPDNLESAMKQIESNKNIIDQQIENVKSWARVLPRPGELSSEYGKNNLAECIKVCDNAIELRDNELTKIDDKLVSGTVTIAKDELANIDKDFQTIDISAIGYNNYIEKVLDVLKSLDSWQKQWRIYSDKISDSNKRKSLTSIIDSSEATKSNYEDIFKQNMKLAINEIAKKSEADAIVINYTNKEQLKDLEKKVNSGISELENLKKKSMPHKQEINLLIQEIGSKFKDRCLEIKDQKRFNTVVDDLGLTTKSRADLDEFKNRLDIAQQRLNSSFSDANWSMINWENTHVIDEVDALREQVEEYQKYVSQLVKLKICCGTFLKSEYNKIEYSSPVSFEPFKTQVKNIAIDIRKGAYRAIQNDIIDFPKIDLQQDEVQFKNQLKGDSPYKFIGFLDKNSGANVVHHCVVRFLCKELPPGPIAVCTNGDILTIGNIKVDPQTGKRVQYFLPGADAFVGKPVYMKVQK